MEGSRTSPGVDDDFHHRLSRGLSRVAGTLEAAGVPVPELEGKLLRPFFALALVPREARDGLDDRFWFGALAIQMVHEASLLHDDVIDAAEVRRGRETVAAADGVARAVVLGDHYLTGAYRAAARTRSFEFLERFTEAVERTVAGEIAQGRAAGRRMTTDEYDAAITGKSGELFGIAGLLGAVVAGLGDADERYATGRAFGNLYQRIDDLLDYCHLADTGKPPLQDYRQRKWSWVLELADVADFDRSDEEVVSRVFAPDRRVPSAARRAVEVLRARERAILRCAEAVGAATVELERLLGLCVGTAECDVREQEDRMARATADGTRPGSDRVTRPVGDRDPRVGGRLASDRRARRTSAEAVVRERARALGGPRAWREYFGDHARTFHLAARLFPPREAGLVTGLYAYCRFTDDLVDEPHDHPEPDVLRARLDVWREMSLAAYERTDTGIPLLDTVMGQAARHHVARSYPEALLEGVGMDLTPRRYRTASELERYTFGVAGAVGGWMSQLFGVHDPAMLERAHALGHGMQLTNIARDVGEDLRNGRVYLPVELMDQHGLSVDDLEAMQSGEAEITEPYRLLVRALMERADGFYEEAWPGIRALPPLLRRPVAAAAAAYRGIHREIRRHGYDNLTERAYTSLPRKLFLAGTGLIHARRSS